MMVISEVDGDLRAPWQNNAAKLPIYLGCALNESGGFASGTHGARRAPSTFAQFPRRRTAAFTFVEVLAALMFLAIVIPTIISALTLSNRASELTERGGAAAQLAENKLNEMLLDDAWQSASETRGDFGADWPNYRWELTQNTWSTDSASGLTELKMEVFFKVQGNERSLALTTLVNPPSSTATTTTTTGGTATP